MKIFSEVPTQHGAYLHVDSALTKRLSCSGTLETHVTASKGHTRNVIPSTRVADLLLRPTLAISPNVVAP